MAACQPIRTPISPNQTTSYWSPPPFFVSFLSPFFLGNPPFLFALYPLPLLFSPTFPPLFICLLLADSCSQQGWDNIWTISANPIKDQNQLQSRKKASQLKWTFAGNFKCLLAKTYELSNMSTTTKNYYRSYIGTINLLLTTLNRYDMVSHWENNC